MIEPNLESFCPKLRAGRVIPQGSRIIFETDNPYNQIVLPMALADMILLCSGQFSVREIIEKIYKKQGSVPFRSILTALHLLHQGGFFENGDQLVLSSHLQSWMGPRQSVWTLSWRFGQRISSESRSPLTYYIGTLLAILVSIFGLQYLPAQPVQSLEAWWVEQDAAFLFFQLLVSSSILTTWRYMFCGIQLLLLTSKAYNVSLRMSPWGIHLHVGDEANDLFENRLYTSMFHVSQILSGWAIVLVDVLLLKGVWFEPLVTMASVITFWELNPFVNSEGRKLIRALLIPSDRDVVSWHFEANQLINSINPDARRRAQDFVNLCGVWGIVWLGFGFSFLQHVAVLEGPTVLVALLRFDSALPFMGLAAWLGALYYGIQSLIEVIGAGIIRPYWQDLWARTQRLRPKARRDWSMNDVVKTIEGLPLFSHFHEEYLERIVRDSQVLDFSEGSTILLQGDPARELYVLLEGVVEIRRAYSRRHVDEDLRLALNAVSIFGESALVDETPRGATVVARTRVAALRVPIFLIREVALESQSVRHLEVFRNAIMVNQFFASSPVFRSLSSNSIEYLCSRGTLEYFDQDHCVFKQGDTGDSLYLILRGAVEVEVHGTVIKRLHQGSFFGEISLIANIPRTATVRAREPSVFFKISSDAFWEVLVRHMDLGVFIETISEARLKEDLDVLPRIENAS